MKNYPAASLQQSSVLSKISENYPKLHNNFENRFSGYSVEISAAENVQNVADSVDRQVDQSMQPAYVGGRVLRNIYDYFFPQTKSQEFTDLSSISGDQISAAQLQSFIDSKRNQSADGYVDLSPLSGLKLQGQTLKVSVDDRISEVDLGEIQVFSGLNVSRTNFPEIFSMNSSYFYNSDFSQNRFGNMADVFFDGCNLHRANMSQTTQTNLYFAGVPSYFLVDEIQKINGYLEYPDDPLTNQQVAAFAQQLQVLKAAYGQLKSTQVTQVGLQDVRFLHGVYDDQTTNYQNTSFRTTTFDFPYATLIGRNLDLNGASYKLENGSYAEIKSSINQVIVDGKIVEPINPAPAPIANGANVTAAQFQAEINQRKRNSNGAIVDLRDLKNVIIQTNSITIASIAFGEYKKIDAIEAVIEGINFTGTNFAEIPSLVNGKYFRNCNFAGCRFGNTVDTTFDGCDLTNADMSDTLQVGIMLGADLKGIRSYIGIGFADEQIHLNIEGGLNYSDQLTQIAAYEKFIADTNPTKFVNVNLRGAIFRRSDNTYRTGFDAVTTDYNQTDFTGVEIESRFLPVGENLNLQGAVIKAPYSNTAKSVTDPVSAAEIRKRFGAFMDSAVRNAIISRPVPGKKTIIAISAALQSDDQAFFDKCAEVYPYGNREGLAFIPVNIVDIQNLADIYSEEYHKYNVEFVVDTPDQPRDFRLNVCFDSYAEAGEAGTVGLINPELFLNLGLGVDRKTKLHEFGHLLGSGHPGDSIIDVTKCSVMASTMCHPNALDIMMPLGNATLPSRLDYGQENLAPQDHQLAGFLFSENPDYQPQDYQANIMVGHNRIIYGDAGYNNSAILDTSSLPDGTKWVVLDAQKSIGTCYNFPCREEDLAEGLQGNLLVLYQENEQGLPAVIGSTLIFGGKTNNVIVDGKIIEPINPFASATITSEAPVTFPTQPITELPTESTNHDKKDLNNIIMAAALIGVVGLGVSAFCFLRKSRSSTSVANQNSEKEPLITMESGASTSVANQNSETDLNNPNQLIVRNGKKINTGEGETPQTSINSAFSSAAVSVSDNKTKIKYF